MIDLILARSGKIMDTLKQQNIKASLDDYSPGQLISVYFSRIEDTTQIADEVGLPFTTKKIMNQVVYQMRQRQIYKDEHKLWKAKTAIDHTWDNFKTHFSAAYHDTMEDNKFGTKGAGYVQCNDR